ncbi:MAG: metallophosphoesterase family protein [Planctomycetes bacterium]|nr:metallophosphoesterase family protein [Planctomycetota bacterium]
MKYGILGDVHANLTALRAVLARFDAEGVTTVLSVGDIVGYGAAPRECIQLVRSVGALVVKGNHDAACVGELDLRYFNNYAREAMRWTQRIVSEEECAWLASLPFTLDLEHCSVGHGTYRRPELFDYVQSTTDADPSLDVLPTPVCFVGHTHVPVTCLRLRDDPLRTAYTTDTEIDLSESLRALVNVGSVGQPRDEDPRAAYAIFDPETQRVRIERVEYDIELEARRIRTAGLPPVLADRLFLGV